MSTVKINEQLIASFFRSRGRFTMRELRLVRILAERMAEQARRNASGELLRRRTGLLAESVRPIVRLDPLSDGVRVGVGSLAPYAGYLEHGTGPHPIVARNRRFLASRADNPDPLERPRRGVNHPGNEPKHWLRAAVMSVIGRPFR